MKALAILLLVVVLSSAILLYKTINALPLSELRRRARSVKNGPDQVIYKLASFEPSLSIFLWLLAGFSSAALLILATHISGWLALFLILLLSWLVLNRRLLIQPGGWLWEVASFIAIPATAAVSFLHPVFSRLGRVIGGAKPKTHTNVYEKEDLLELLNFQAGQLDNRIAGSELKIAKGALSFADKKVSRVMTPTKDVKWLGAGEAIGPMLMDELHKTGFIRFPVVKDTSKSADREVVGALYINDLLKNLEKTGTVRDIMASGAHFIGETHTLHQALDAFLKSKQHLLVVVNNFEEISGILTLEDVLEQILGQKITDDFDSYHDLRAVAGHDPESTKSAY